MTLAQDLLQNPVVVLLLGVVLESIIQSTKGIGPRRAWAYHHVRRVVWPLAHPLFKRRGRPLIWDKTDADDEYVATVDVGMVALLKALWSGGFRWNPLSMLKYREFDGTRQYGMSVVKYSGDGWQQDVHIFRNPNGGLDLLGHWEPAPTDPDDHVGGDEQEDGDPQGYLRDVLVSEEIGYEQRPPQGGPSQGN